jgi:hypothetical protein
LFNLNGASTLLRLLGLRATWLCHWARKTLVRLVTSLRDNPEAWYDLAAIQATLSKTNEAVASLSRAVQLSNQRLAQQPKAKNPPPWQLWTISL